MTTYFKPIDKSAIIHVQCHEKVQEFGKRCQAAKRDPNCPVVIRGWLKLKFLCNHNCLFLRWFVLSNYCLYYYKDSREESVLGSIPLPSYRILYCSPRECRNRKYAFKVRANVLWISLNLNVHMVSLGCGRTS
uniref:PH domain-containing protein n=1 Tax=Sinocyclocheilus grahami TaxID=75366 RepID=A0A672KMA2_SINGR